jgi:hypothetical protein
VGQRHGIGELVHSSTKLVLPAVEGCVMSRLTLGPLSDAVLDVEGLCS